MTISRVTNSIVTKLGVTKSLCKVKKDKVKIYKVKSDKSIKTLIPKLFKTH